MRLFEEEEETKIDSLPNVKPGEDIIINDIPFLTTAIFQPAVIQYHGNIPNPLYNKNSKSVRNYYTKNTGRKGEDIDLKNFFTKYPDLLTDENLDLPLGTFINQVKQSGNPDYKMLINSFGDEEFYVKFKSENLTTNPGLYIWVVDNKPEYIGIATGGLHKRINLEYGSITPYKCTIDGQKQTCSTNVKLRDEFDVKKSIALYILPIDVEKYVNDPKFMEFMNKEYKFKGTRKIKNILEVFEKFIIGNYNFKDSWNKRMEESFINRFQELAGIKSIP